jgi:hypothetical protein
MAEELLYQKPLPSIAASAARRIRSSIDGHERAGAPGEPVQAARGETAVRRYSVNAAERTAPIEPG